MSNSKKLKNMLKTKPILKIGGAFDALSAKLVETTGYDAIWAGSFAISATHGITGCKYSNNDRFPKIC